MNATTIHVDLTNSYSIGIYSLQSLIWIILEEEF